MQSVYLHIDSDLAVRGIGNPTSIIGEQVKMQVTGKQTQTTITGNVKVSRLWSEQCVM